MLWGACHNPKLYFPGFQGLFLMFMDHPIGILYHRIIHFNLISVCVCADFFIFTLFSYGLVHGILFKCLVPLSLYVQQSHALS